MKKHLKKLGVCLVMYCLSQSVAYGETFAANENSNTQQYTNAIALYINSECIKEAAMPPIQIGGRVLVPAREVFSTLGAYVDWKAAENKVYIEYEDILIVLEIDSSEAWVNGEIKTLDMPAKLINNKVMIPLRFISEAIGFNVEWNSNTSSVYINKGNSTSLNEVSGSDQNLNIGTNSAQVPVVNLENDVTKNPIINEVKDPLVSVDDVSVLDHIGYEHMTNTVVLQELNGLSIDDLQIDNAYRDRKITITLPGNISLETGTKQINSGYLSTLQVTDNNQLILKTNTVCELIVSQEQGSLYMKLVKPKEKYEKIVVLDAGHGGTDNGTSYAGIYEKDLTLSYSEALYNLLSADKNIKVYVTRDQDVYPTLQDRVALSNEIEPDLYISIHINSVEGNEAAHGTETFYTEVASDTRGKTFAQMVQAALVNRFGTRDRGVKDGGLYVTRMTNDPAILIEAGFLTNEAERAMMTASNYPSEYAEVVYGCILEYYAKGLHDKN